MKNNVLPVNSEKCFSCPFNLDEKGRYLNDALAVEIQQNSFTSSHICHHHRLIDKPESHLCRGARDWQLEIFHRLGWLEEATDECWLRISKDQ